jgi:hypothetical protein
VADTYVTNALDKGFVEGWQKLVTMHDELRPLLLSPDETGTLPPLTPQATPEAGVELADQAIKAAEEARGPQGTDRSVAETLQAAKEYFEVAKADATRRPGLLRRGFTAIGGAVATILKISGSATALATWFTTPTGQAFLAHMRTIWDAIKNFFVP